MHQNTWNSMWMGENTHGSTKNARGKVAPLHRADGKERKARDGRISHNAMKAQWIMITGWHKKVDMFNWFVFNFLLFGDMYVRTQVTIIVQNIAQWLTNIWCGACGSYTSGHGFVGGIVPFRVDIVPHIVIFFQSCCFFQDVHLHFIFHSFWASCSELASCSQLLSCD